MYKVISLLALLMFVPRLALAKAPICDLTLEQRFAAIAVSKGPWNNKTMQATDDVLGEYLAEQNSDEYAGWKRPAALPQMFISDCYRWQRTVAEARYPGTYTPGGTISFVAELLNDTSMGALRVAVHERIHQWQPRWQDVYEKNKLEAKVQLLERLLAKKVRARVEAMQ